MPPRSAKQTPPWGQGQFLEIRYEDLVTNPETVMRAVIDFIGEDWHAAAGKFEGKADEFDIVLKATGKASTTLDRLRRPIEQSRVGLFPQVLTAAELDRVASRVAEAGWGDLYQRVIADTPQLASVAAQ